MRAAPCDDGCDFFYLKLCVALLHFLSSAASFLSPLQRIGDFSKLFKNLSKCLLNVLGLDCEVTRGGTEK